MTDQSYQTIRFSTNKLNGLFSTSISLPVEEQGTFSMGELSMDKFNAADLSIADLSLAKLNVTVSSEAESNIAEYREPALICLVPEMKTKIFKLLFANKGPHEACGAPTTSPRSGQLLRVCKKMHEDASIALYSMTEFHYSGMPAYNSAYQPASKYHKHIRLLKVEDPEYIATFISDYTNLGQLTIEVPSFLILESGALARSKLRSSDALRQILHIASGMPKLEVAIQGEHYFLGNGRYTIVRKRNVVKAAGMIVPSGFMTPMLKGNGHALRSGYIERWMVDQTEIRDRELDDRVWD